MFGSKQAKEENLARLVQELRNQREMTTGEMAKALNVSQDAVEDYLVSLDDHNVKLCQKGHKISLLETWFGKK
jgi:predicted transcriptional regulator